MNIKEEKIKEELFLNGIKAFNNRRYYDAHEYWEDLWSDYQLKDAKFIQGLIQLSVGYFHITNLNINGAKGLFNKCLLKLELYKEGARGIDVILIIDAVHKTIYNLNKIDNIKDFNWNNAPTINA
tara:strand:+ start:3830 stop:4204 length:375 start_codon:yes stop_codon:yes gene_type:complete